MKRGLFSGVGRWLRIALLCAAFAPIPAQSGTVSVVDLQSSTVYPVSTSMCSGNSAGVVIYTGCWSGLGKFLSPQSWGPWVFLTADLSSLSGIAFDHVFLSLTEIRTVPVAKGEAGVYLLTSAAPIPDVGAANLTAIDAWLAGGMSLVGNLAGTAVGGHQLLLDITSSVVDALGLGMDQIGLLLRDDVGNGSVLEVLGNNYHSGFPSCADGFNPCQYYARSLYEYPTLIATVGTDITPFDQLPPRPILHDPLGPPRPPHPPADVTAPTSIALVGLALLMLVLGRRYRGGAGLNS